jgi:hypothetical protein
VKDDTLLRKRFLYQGHHTLCYDWITYLFFIVILGGMRFCSRSTTKWVILELVVAEALAALNAAKFSHNTRL